MTRPSEGTASAQRILREVPVAGRRCIDTGRVVIGSRHAPAPRPLDADAERLQTALLDPHTAAMPCAWRRAVAPLWRWC